MLRKIILIISFLFAVVVIQGQQIQQVPVTTSASQEFVTNQISWLKIYIDAKFDAQKEAVDKVEKTTTARFEAQNEWRQSFNDQKSTFVSRRELTGLYGTVIAIVGLFFTALAYVSKTKKPLIP